MLTKVIVTYNCPQCNGEGRLVLDIIKMATAENRFIALWAARVTQVYLGTTQSCQKYFMPNRTMVVALHMFDYYSTR